MMRPFAEIGDVCALRICALTHLDLSFVIADRRVLTALVCVSSRTLVSLGVNNLLQDGRGLL